MATQLLPVGACSTNSQCYIEASPPNIILSNGTDDIAGPDPSLSRSGFSTAGVVFTAYVLVAQIVSGSWCESYTVTSSLATPFFVPAPTSSVDAFYDVAATSFVYSINPACAAVAPYHRTRPILLTTLHLSRSTVPIIHSSTSFQVPTVSALSTARAVSSSTLSPQDASTATAKPSSTSSPLIPATNSTETRKFMIGLIMTIVVPVVLMALSVVYLIRRRRRRKEKAPSSYQDIGKREGEDAQLYFLQKVELDDEQQRHELEDVEIRYEMEGDNEIHEMPVEGNHGQIGRQGPLEGRKGQGVRHELRGAEHAKELDNSQ